MESFWKATREVSDIAVNFDGLGEVGRFAKPELRERLENHLIEVLLAAEFDDLSKLSALIAIAELGPELPPDKAEKMLAVVYPITEGTLPESAPEEITSRPNPKRARSRFSCRASATQLEAAALQAAGRLSLFEENPERLERALEDALASGARERVQMALRILADRPTLAVEVDLEPLLALSDRGLREAARRLQGARNANVGDSGATAAL